MPNKMKSIKFISILFLGVFILYLEPLADYQKQPTI